MERVIRLNERDLHNIINESVKTILQESTDEGWGKNLAMAGMMGLGMLGGMHNAQAQTYNKPTVQDSTQVTQNVQQQTKFTNKQLKKMFPQAYRDRNASPDVWSKNRNKYTAQMPNGKISLAGLMAAAYGKNPWDAIVRAYSSEYQEPEIYKLSDFDFD